MPSAPTTTDLAQLAADVYHTSEALTATAQDVPSSVSALLQEFDALHRALEQNHTLTQWTGRQPPPLGAVHEILRQSLDCVDKQRVVASQSRPPHARRDSGRAVEVAWSGIDHDSIRARLAHTILTLRNLNFVTVLIAGFVDFHTSSERSQLHANLSDASRTTNDDRELSSLLDGFARLGYHHHRLTASNNSRAGHTEHSRQLVKVEEQNKDLLRRLLAYTRLQSHPLARLPIASLISRCSMEHQGSIISIGSLAARRATDIPSGLGASFTDCPVSIELDGHTATPAQGFRLADGSLRWLGADGHVVFEHRLQDRKKRIPWRYTTLHKPLTVSFTAWDSVGSKALCYRRHHHDHVDQSPDYVFANEKHYELFQTALRDRAFLKEFEVKAIKTKNADKTENSVVKFWGPREASPAAITIPVTFIGNQVRHQDVPVKWMSCTKVQSSKEVRLDLKQAKRRASSGAHTSSPSNSGHGSKRPNIMQRMGTALSRHGTTSTSAEVIVPGELAPPNWVDTFPYFTLDFVDDTARDAFVDFFEKQQRGTTPVRVPSRTSVPSLDIGSPWLSETSSTFPGSTPNTMNSGAFTTAPTTTNLSSSPTAMTGANIATEISLGPAFADTLRPPEVEEEPVSPGSAGDPGPAFTWHDFLRRGGPKPLARSFDSISDHFDSPYYETLEKNRENIRIMRIEPGSGHDVCCNLEVHNLRDLPPYEALSYCWGKAAATAQISSGNLKGFPVSEHLFYAIRRLRHESRPRYIWVDAICINQVDVHERNHQIQMMRRIYTLARRTIIWMGEFDPEKKSCPRSEGDDKTLCTLPDHTTSVEHDDVARDLPKNVQQLKEKDRTGSTELWFRRLWCVQEFHFSQTLPSVYIGRHAVRWDHFSSMFKPPSDPLALSRGLGQFNSNEATTNHLLFELLYMTGKHRCSDPRDRIFALLGMARDAAAGIQPDYRKSVIRVIEEACLRLIKESDSVDVLLDERVSRNIWGAERFQNVVPSWIPDLTRLQTREAIRSPDMYSAGPGAAEVELVEDKDASDDEFDRPRILRLRAVLYDRISKRTTESDIPKYEHSPNECLIYNSLKHRGHIIQKILDVLQYRFEDVPPEHQHLEILDQTPRFGRLFLDYLFEGKRSVKQELEDRSNGPQRNVGMSFEHQEAEDLAYCRHERSTEDEDYVKKRWSTKRSRMNKVYVPEQVDEAYNSDNDSFRQDFEMARDLENLFAYARRSKRWYYLTVGNFDAPMRKDVLKPPNKDEVMMLKTQFYSQARDLEFHDYAPKHRERDFFKTSAGFVGLGPSSLEVNDEIVIPLGSSRPLILRKCQGVLGSYYTLVGEAVLPGLMSGKWTKVELEKKNSAEWYRIK
ncbi:hypothetical protein PRZ48_000234 [Zasmidium cellare]|uniref:Heterokaryon incompatibility domain-containing protein n=1 Tax=Zasmidium cellare TaxID=395010 RepID=A0ABR0EXY8_ZASCE|nr:hypothetical protein PRZ48_000234 [Zasmidium cellare]